MLNFRRMRKQLLLLLAVVGPGIITAFADNDAGGVATYSVAAAKFGYGMLTTIIPITIVLMITQEIGSRLAVVTGERFRRPHPRTLWHQDLPAYFRTSFFVNLGVIIQDLGDLKTG